VASTTVPALPFGEYSTTETVNMMATRIYAGIAHHPVWRSSGSRDSIDGYMDFIVYGSWSSGSVVAGHLTEIPRPGNIDRFAIVSSHRETSFNGK
jgi:hypothetical protein